MDVAAMNGLTAVSMKASSLTASLPGKAYTTLLSLNAPMRAPSQTISLKVKVA